MDNLQTYQSSRETPFRPSAMANQRRPPEINFLPDRGVLPAEITSPAGRLAGQKNKTQCQT
jgi:hypothetical protein